MKASILFCAVALPLIAASSLPQPRDTALRPRNSPVYNPTEIFTDPQKAIDAAVKQTITQDVQFTLDQFANLPDYVSSVVKQAVKLPLSQAITGLSATEQLEKLSKQVKDKLAAVQNDVIEDISKLQAGVGDDTANFEALKTCIGEIVKQGGLLVGQSCLSESGLAIDSITKQFNMFTEINDFQLPAEAINSATKDINAYLDSVTLYPGAEAIISQTQGAIQNVQLAQAATERDAAQASFKCLINAIQVISTTPLSERYLQCDLGNTETTSFADSALARVEQSYIQATNQYAGFLPANIVQNVQAIGMQALSLSLDPYQASTRKVINDAILSSVAATSGETATLALSLQKCLNTMLDLSTETTCDPERNLAIVQGNMNIYNNYLSQFVSILPKELVLGLYQKTSELAAETDQDEAEIRAQLDALFQQASAGTEYETCYRQFEDCLVEGIQAGASSADATCAKGSSCDGLVPQLTPDRPSGASPYAGIAGRKRALAAAQQARKRLLRMKSKRAI